MVTRFIPLTLDLIEEGAFMDDLRRAFRFLQSDLIAYQKEHGIARVKGTKAKIAVEITLGCEGVAHSFSVRSAMKMTRPLRPAAATLAQDSEHPEDGEPALFVQRIGSHDGHPSTAPKMFGRDGSPADEPKGVAMVGPPDTDGPDDDEGEDPVRDQGPEEPRYGEEPN